jgi:hypothetical protein
MRATDDTADISDGKKKEGNYQNNEGKKTCQEYLKKAAHALSVLMILKLKIFEQD